MNFQMSFNKLHRSFRDLSLTLPKCSRDFLNICHFQFQKDLQNVCTATPFAVELEIIQAIWLILRSLNGLSSDHGLCKGVLSYTEIPSIISSLNKEVKYYITVVNMFSAIDELSRAIKIIIDFGFTFPACPPSWKKWSK